MWVGRNPHKGLAVLGIQGPPACACAPEHDPTLAWSSSRRCGSRARLSFNLLAVWAQNASGGNTRKDQPGPLNLALARYRGFLAAEDRRSVAGDFNNNVFWDKPGWAMNHAGTVAALESCGLVSAYHWARGERPRAERTADPLLARPQEGRPDLPHRLHLRTADWTVRICARCGSGVSPSGAARA